MSFSNNVLNLEGHHLRNPFWRELEEEGTITFRDNSQFELKSEFFIDPEASETHFTQEFYLFIPDTLQINPQTYSAQHFYLDQLNLIRYKTPSLTFEELVDEHNPKSPLHRIQTNEDFNLSLTEMVLFGNMFRTSLRFRVRSLLKKLVHSVETHEEACVQKLVEKLIADVAKARKIYTQTKRFLIDHCREATFVEKLDYIDEYISIACEEYFTILLRILRESKTNSFSSIDTLICEMIDNEKLYRQNQHLHPQGDGEKESILYKQGLLEKFMLSPLRLDNTRIEIKEHYGQLIGAVAAGIAMLVYMILFVWKATTFVINSAPFVLLAVFLYILKDRIKEGMKMLYAKHINRWFPDYKTHIYNSNREIIGQLKESFLFIPKTKLPKGFAEMRMRHAKDPLEAYQPKETIVQYKKSVQLYKTNDRLSELNTIFRFNIHQFINKANDALQPTLSLSKEGHELEEILLPKVYHLNLILKSNFIDRKKRRCEEIKAFRVVLDKNGIKRVEHTSSKFKILSKPKN